MRNRAWILRINSNYVRTVLSSLNVLAHHCADCSDFAHGSIGLRGQLDRARFRSDLNQNPIDLRLWLQLQSHWISTRIQLDRIWISIELWSKFGAISIASAITTGNVIGSRSDSNRNSTDSDCDPTTSMPLWFKGWVIYTPINCLLLYCILVCHCVDWSNSDCPIRFPSDRHRILIGPLQLTTTIQSNFNHNPTEIWSGSGRIKVKIRRLHVKVILTFI